MVDEAGMAATEDIHRLMRLSTDHRWRVVCVGDPHQLPAVGRGGTFAHWTTTLPHHELVEARRFTEPWEATPSLALRAGDPTAAHTYADHGRLATSHPALLPDRVARRYLTHHANGQSVAITTTTADTARRINTSIQRTTAPPRRVEVRLADGTRTGAGDTIATRHNDLTLTTHDGHQVRHRHTWTVLAARRNGSLIVDHPDRGTLDLPATYVSTHVELGWAVTGYGNQGDSTDIGIAILEPTTTRNHAYVALTRGRHSNTGLIVDETGAADPEATLCSVITRSPAGGSALATRDRLTGARDVVVRGTRSPAPRSGDIFRRRLAEIGRRDGGPSDPER